MSDSDQPEDQAHDVLAAEAFAVPARDPSLHHGPVELPEDPTGIAEPHDVLAAEEFPMPAAGAGSGGGLVRPEKTSHKVGIAVMVVMLVILVRRRRRRPSPTPPA